MLACSFHEHVFLYWDAKDDALESNNVYACQGDTVSEGLEPVRELARKSYAPLFRLRILTLGGLYGQSLRAADDACMYLRRDLALRHYIRG